VGAPHTPRKFQALIIQEDDSVCTALRNLTQLSVMWWEMVAYKYKITADGFTEEYANLITAALEACPDEDIDFDGIVPNPQDFKNFLLSPTSIFCEKFVKLATGLSQKLYEWVAFEWNDEADDFTDEFKALLCGLDCNEPESIDIQSLLNYRDFDKWDVTDGEVDLVGLAPWVTAIANPDGMYVDLHGTYHLDGARSGAGVIRIKEEFAVQIEAGKQYSITFQHAGHGLSNAVLSRPGTVIATLRKTSDLTQYESVTAEWTAAAWNSDFTERELTFTAGASAECIFELAADPDTATWGGTNVGPKIDTVRIRNVTDDVTLFYDDFEFEESRSGAVDCPTPDPDDSLAAIPNVSMETCERLSKLLQDFPQNLYDVASFEFAPSGSGFSKCLKAWLCNPTGTLDNDLLSGLVAWWKHDEASGDVEDAHTNAYDLTEFNGTASTQAGKVGSSRAYPIDVSARRADADWNDLSDKSWTFACWFNLPSLTFPGIVSNSITLMQKGEFSTDYDLSLRPIPAYGGTDFELICYPGVLGEEMNVGTLAVDTWYFAVARFDSTTGIVTLSFGNGTTLTHQVGTTVVTPDSNTARYFSLGGKVNPTYPFGYASMAVDLDEAALWHQVLTDEQVTTLFNEGAGITYEDLT
jgi:hypothetical protein